MAVTVAPPAEPTATEPPRPPYPGLRPFTESDAAFFYGRAAEVEIVAANLLSSRLTLVYGASGVGKTSVLLAGVAHTLRRQAEANLDDEDEFNDFAVVVISSWADPEPNKVIAAAARAEVAALLGREDLPEPPDGATLAAVLEHWSDQLGGKLLIVFDQFEEYFRYHHDDRRAGTFDAEFPQAVNGVDVPVHFLLSVRDDELARLDHFKGRIPKLFDNRVKIDHLTCPGAERAIRRPLEKLHADQRIGIEDELVNALLANCAVRDPALAAESLGADGRPAVVKAPTGSVKAPLLQLVLERLWRCASEEQSQTLTLAQLESLGGVEGILDTHLRTALEALSPAAQDIAAKCFGLLASPTKTKMAYPVSVLARVAGRDDEREVTAVLDELCSAESGHILNAVDTGQDEGSRNYEISNADLLTEPIVAWQKEHDEKRRREAEEARRVALRRKYRNRTIILVTTAAIFAALGAWAWVQRNEAKAAARSAASVALASTADEQLSTHRDVALLLSLEAYHAKKTPQAERSMRAALAAVLSSGANVLRGNQGGVTAVAFSEDGKTLAVAGSDGTVLLWDPAGHRKLGSGLEGDHGAVTALSLHASTLAAAYADGTVLLWNLGKQTVQESLSPSRKNAGAVTALAFSKTGTTLAAADSDGTLRIWNHRDGKEKWTRFGQVLGNDASPVNGMVLSEDGEAIAATSSFDGKIRIWFREGGRWTRSGAQSAKKLTGRAITAVALNPDGHTLATAFEPDYEDTGTSAGAKAAVMLWDLDSEKQGRLIPLDKTGINDLAFSRNGKTLATAGADGTVHVFDAHALALTERGRPLNGHQGSASSVAFAKGGKVLASGYDDGTVLLWRLDAPNASSSGHRMSDAEDGSGSVAFSLDGTKFATASLQDTLQLWDARGRKLGRPLDGDQDGIWGVSFSPDGKLVTAVDSDGKVVLWSTQKPVKRVAAFRAGGGLYSVAFSRDGKVLATAGDSGVQLWDLRTRTKLGTAIDPHQGGVAAIAFSPKGNTLAIANFNGTVQLWDMTTGTPVIKPLYVGKNGVVDVAFRPDGDMLATAGTNGTVRLWDIRDLEHPTSHLLSGNQQYVWGVAFSPDGNLVAAAGDDGTVAIYNLQNHTRQLVKRSRDTVYDVAFSKDRTLAAAAYDGTVLWYAKDIELPWRDFDDLKTKACALVSGNLTKSEWTALVPPGQSYRRTCPAR